MGQYRVTSGNLAERIIDAASRRKAVFRLAHERWPDANGPLYAVPIMPGALGAPEAPEGGVVFAIMIPDSAAPLGFVSCVEA